jgi:hypothetical protein
MTKTKRISTRSWNNRPIFPEKAPDQLSALVWVIGIWNLEFVWNLVLDAWYFNLASIRPCPENRLGEPQNPLQH